MPLELGRGDGVGLMMGVIRRLFYGGLSKPGEIFRSRSCESEVPQYALDLLGRAGVGIRAGGDSL